MDPPVDLMNAGGRSPHRLHQLHRAVGTVLLAFDPYEHGDTVNNGKATINGFAFSGTLQTTGGGQDPVIQGCRSPISAENRQCREDQSVLRQNGADGPAVLRHDEHHRVGGCHLAAVGNCTDRPASIWSCRGRGAPETRQCIPSGTGRQFSFRPPSPACRLLGAPALLEWPGSRQDFDPCESPMPARRHDSRTGPRRNRRCRAAHLSSSDRRLPAALLTRTALGHRSDIVRSGDARPQLQRQDENWT